MWINAVPLRLSCCLCVLLLTGWLLAGSAVAKPQCYVGTAFSLQGNNTLYTESYLDRRNDNGKLLSTRVHYRTTDGHPLADKTLQYGNHPYAPDYTFVNHITGYQEQLQWLADGKVRLSYQEQNGQQHNATLSVSTPAVADAGFNAYVQDHLTQLATGNTLHFHFLNPARLTWYRFSAKGKRLDNGDVEVTIQPDSLLLRWMVDPIILQYSQTDKRLLQYQGLTNISLDGSHSLQARIDYRYWQKPATALSRSAIPLQYQHCDSEG